MHEAEKLLFLRTFFEVAAILRSIARRGREYFGFYERREIKTLVTRDHIILDFVRFFSIMKIMEESQIYLIKTKEFPFQ